MSIKILWVIFMPLRCIDEVYVNLIQDELIELEDFVPPRFLTSTSVSKRNRWIKESNNQWIHELNRKYKRTCWGLTIVKEGEPKTELFIFISETIKEFIEKYLQYSQLINDWDVFGKRLWKLKKEVYGL